MEIKDNKKQILPQNLLAQIAEDLKVPLGQIARLSELGLIHNASADVGLGTIKSISQSALKIIDSYALSLRLANIEPNSLAVEPLAAGAILAQVVEEIKPLADTYGVKLRADVSGRCLPILANRQVLTSALANIGRSLTEMITTNNEAGQQSLRLSLKKCGSEIEAGWYWRGGEKLDTEILNRGQTLLGKSRQPLAAITDGQVSGIFVADYILSAMNCRLRPSKLDNLSGLAVKLKTSKQLALI